MNIEFLSHLPEEDQKKFCLFAGGPSRAPSFPFIHLAFEKMVSLYPNAIATEHLGEQMTYAELNFFAEHLCQELIRMGVVPGDHVGLFVQRSISMVVGIIAILKAGAAYVPQDARIAPEAQLAHVIRTANTKVILTLSDLKENIPQSNDSIALEVDTFIKYMQSAKDNLTNNLPMPSTFSKLKSPDLNSDLGCFVLFTSGTTGLPNGVKVTHKNVCNILLTSPGDLGMKPGLKVSQILNIGFDMAAWEILGALSHGCTLVIRGKDISAAVEKVDIVIATPTILNSVDIEKCRQVKVVAVAGEPCPKPLADRWAQFCDFYNSCGPTEVTIVNTMQKYEPALGRLTIGKPTPNNTVYILDENLTPCAIGDVGEMWAGGDCVSSGYLDNEELNSDRYRNDPFLGGGKKMFRTRDLGRWTADGELEHFGRTDDQVKIRGFRVELDSVSNFLEKTPGCAKAVTLKLNDRNLVAFVSPRSVNIGLAKELVSQGLPYYCTPSLIIALDEFPMTSRGKVDKRALTVMAVAKQEEQIQMPPITEVAL